MNGVIHERSAEIRIIFDRCASFSIFNLFSFMNNVFILFIFCLLIGFPGYAQLSKGRTLLGGSLSASVSNNQQNTASNQFIGTSRQFSIAPKAGVFVSNRWVVGLTPNFSSAYQKFDLSEHETTQRTYGLGLFARYYQPVGDKFSFFGELTGPDFGFYRNEFVTSNRPQPSTRAWNRGTYFRAGAFLGTGAAYFVTPKIGLEASFGSLGFGITQFSGTYRDSNGGQGDANSDNKDFSFSLQPNTLNLGVSFYLGG
jgi:hypothetical protein